MSVQTVKTKNYIIDASNTSSYTFYVRTQMNG